MKFDLFENSHKLLSLNFSFNIPTISTYYRNVFRLSSSIYHDASILIIDKLSTKDGKTAKIKNNKKLKKQFHFKQIVMRLHIV